MAAAAHLAQVLGSRAGAISTAVIDAEYAERPELWTRFGEEGRARALEDAVFHVKFLCTALSMGLPDLFAGMAALPAEGRRDA